MVSSLKRPLPVRDHSKVPVLELPVHMPWHPYLGYNGAGLYSTESPAVQQRLEVKSPKEATANGRV